MRILITGINGFIGQHLAKELLKRGDIVIGLGQNKKCKVASVTNYYSGSVLDKKLITRAMKDVEVVIHLAALTSHKEIVNNRFETLETNFLGTKKVLDAFSKSKTAKKFFYASTGKVYGKIVDLPISEKHPAHPLNILGKSKLITEQLIDFYNDNQKAFIIFRIFNVYGSGQKESFLMPTILKQLQQNEIVLGDIVAKRDYVFIDDVICAFILAIEKKGLLGILIYNICTGVGSSAAGIIKIINKITGREITIKKNPHLLRDDEMKDEYGSFALIKKNLGWEPKVSLEEGLKILCKQ